MPREHGVKVIGLVRALPRSEKQHPDDIADDLFQRQAVFFIDGHQEKRQHDENHADGSASGAEARRPFEQKEKRYADERTAAKTDELPFCQVEHDLRFHCGQVLGYRNVSQRLKPPFGRKKGRHAGVLKYVYIFCSICLATAVALQISG